MANWQTIEELVSKSENHQDNVEIIIQQEINDPQATNQGYMNGVVDMDIEKNEKVFAQCDSVENINKDSENKRDNEDLAAKNKKTYPKIEVSWAENPEFIPRKSYAMNNQNVSNYDRKNSSTDTTDERFYSEDSIESSYYAQKKTKQIQNRQRYANNYGNKTKEIYVGNINSYISNMEIKRCFSSFGTIINFQRPNEYFCFIEYSAEYASANAIRSSVILKNRNLRIEPKESKSPKMKIITCKVFLSGLKDFTTDLDVYRVLSKYGVILDIYRPWSLRNDRYRIVTFNSTREAQNAALLRKVMIKSKAVKISLKEESQKSYLPPTVFITGIPSSMSERKIINLMSNFGPVKFIDFPHEWNGSCLVTFTYNQSAAKSDLVGHIYFHSKSNPILIRHYHY